MLAKKSIIFRTVQSSSTRTSTIRDQELLKFYANNPTKRKGDSRSLDHDTYMKTNVGDVITCCQCKLGEQIKGITDTAIDPNYSFYLTWDPVDGANYYTVSCKPSSGSVGIPTITYPSSDVLTAEIVYPEDWTRNVPDTFTITAYKTNCHISTSYDTWPKGS